LSSFLISGSKRLSKIFEKSPSTPIRPPAEKIPEVNDDKIVFGVDLNIAITRSNKHHYLLPDVAYQCLVYLEQKGVGEEGIFRLSGSQNQIREFKGLFDKGVSCDLDKCLNPHTVSGLLKLYLRELPHPLFSEITLKDESEVVPVLKELVAKLPDGNRCLLSSICRLLQRISRNEAITKMGVQNLVIVFCATLNCPASILSNFITSAKEIFPDNLLARTKKEKIIIDIFDEDLFGNENKKNEVKKTTEADEFNSEDLELPPAPERRTKKRLQTIFDGDSEDEEEKVIPMVSNKPKIGAKRTYKPELSFLQ